MSNEQRTTQILDAVERLLGRGGLAAVTMRAVAVEAGVSVRLVQYYGSTKGELLTAALERLSARSVERWTTSTSATTLHDCLEAFLLAALPIDDASRALHRVGVSMELLALTESTPVATTYRAHLDRIRDIVVADCLAADSQLTAEQAVDIARLAMSFAHGLGSSVMIGHLAPDEARAAVSSFALAISTGKR